MALKTREKLIEVARQLFVHKGVAKTTMNDIANASDKGRRTIYTYFRNKKEIYDAVLESESETLVTAMRDIVNADAPVEKRLAELLRFRFDHNLAMTAGTVKAWLTLDIMRVDRINRMARMKARDMLESLLARGISDGVFDPERCRLLNGFINDCIYRYDNRTTNYASQASRDKVIDSLVEFIVTDIMAR